MNREPTGTGSAKMNKTITLKDIARETGVHVSTVSRALAPNARATLTEEVIQRVQEAAERLGYRPNRLASGLRTKRTMTVGLMLPDITNTLFPPIVRGVENVLEPQGYASIIVNTDSLPDREARLLDVLLERGVDGIIHAAAARENPRMVTANAQGVPIVTVNRRIESGDIPSVINDDAHGIHLAMEHLVCMGHRRIAHVAGPPALSTGATRRAAFVASAGRFGLDPAATPISDALRFEEAEGERCARFLLENAPGFTALLCANDRLALGAIAALRKAGLSCPADVSVTGFNDVPFLDMITPALTTIRIQQFEVGRISAEVLLRRITDRKAVVPRTTVLPVQLVRRDSVAPPPKSRRR